MSFAASQPRAAASGHLQAFVPHPPRPLLLVTAGLLVSFVFYLMAMPRLGSAEVNVVSCLRPSLMVLTVPRMHRTLLAPLRRRGIGMASAGAAMALGPTVAKGFDPLSIGLAFGSGLFIAVCARLHPRGQERHDVIGPSLGVVAVLAMGCNTPLRGRSISAGRNPSPSFHRSGPSDPL